MHPAVQWLTIIMTELALSPPPAPAAPAPEPAPVIAPGPETAVFILGVEQEVILTSVLNLPWRLGFATRVAWVPRFCRFAFTLVFASHVFFLFYFIFFMFSLVFTAHEHVLFIVCEFLLLVSNFSIVLAFLFSFFFYRRCTWRLGRMQAILFRFICLPAGMASFISCPFLFLCLGLRVCLSLSMWFIHFICFSFSLQFYFR